VISICKIENKHVVKNQLIICLNEISLQAKEMGKIVSVYILGRYRHSSPEGLSELKIQFGESLSIEFKTIHSSKGLQADYVILIGLQSGKMGFPSQIADDPLLELVMPVPETFSHAEERRLFYVGLTRARHGVYLLCSKYAPSVFITELEKSTEIASILRYTDAEEVSSDGNSLEKCSCGKGTIQKKSGKYGSFLGCSAYPACNYTRNV
jgi:DNA helicase-4